MPDTLEAPASAAAPPKMETPPPPKAEPWYKTGIIYEVHVRAFQDSNGDGTGDFQGLTTRLDYLRDLGVTAIWLLPFYPSPLKDDGYDISDYYGVHSKYGTLADFREFLRQAHHLGLKVITELVMNHTSDQHPWFQRARRAKPGSRFRDYYVWSDTSDKYKGTRVIFKDTELSNWTWDPVANAYYWHRFYSHQPDLNFDHEPVQREMIRVLDFWMNLGVDGVRLDAVPYLFEREGTSCENLPETHEFLKMLRKHVDANYSNRMLLGEANQWPEDAAAYFGSGRGDECHMAFHFPLMPRLFMALRMEDRVPIVDILQQTPAIPETSQWALFLRNHDELTLEMVTDEERDYMYRMYAHLQQARLNLGIRRRLAPLLGNDRRRIELLCALLFSLPGTPVIYYGDEIGMGENIYLGDRNGVRTPMQWSADKNAGFSRANPQSLFLPINLDPENHYEAVNVEVQSQNHHSLLWWMKHLIALRKRWKSFGLGTLEFLSPDNRKILAYVRRYENECILVVANLSRFVQPVALDLSQFKTQAPVEMFGHTDFPIITDQPYPLTLGPHAFYWFSIEPKATAETPSSGAPVAVQARGLLHVETAWEEIFTATNRTWMEAALQTWLPSRRWFEGNAKKIKTVNLLETIPIPMPDGKAFLALLQVEYAQAEPEIYIIPLTCGFGEKAELISRDWPGTVVARLSITESHKEGIIFDAIADQDFARAMLEVIRSRRSLQGTQGRLDAMHTPAFRRLHNDGGANLEPSVNKAGQSKSSVIYGDKLILKFFRRLDAGVNPELEISQFLTARNFPYSPPLAGALEYKTTEDDSITVAVLSAFVPDCKTAWDYTLDALGRFYERVETLPAEQREAPSLPAHSLVKLAAMEMPADTREMLGTYVQDAHILGQRTAALHLALASDTENPDFRPEPWTPHAQRGLFQSMRNLTRQNLQLLSLRLKALSAPEQAQAQQVLGLEAALLQRFRRLYEGRIDAARIRTHGDYHLGQILHTGKDFLIIDFEGEPAIPLGERRLKRSPLYDVAGLMLSFHYAAYGALLKQSEHGALQPPQMKSAISWELYWSAWISATFLKAYLKDAQGAPFLPSNEADFRLLLETALLRNAIYELGCELNNRPDWVRIPLVAIIELTKSEAIA